MPTTLSGVIELVAFAPQDLHSEAPLRFNRSRCRAASSALITNLTTRLAGVTLHSTLVEKKPLLTEPTTPGVDATAAM